MLLIRDFFQPFYRFLNILPGLAYAHSHEGVLDHLRASWEEKAYWHADYTKFDRYPAAERKVYRNAAIRHVEAVLTNGWPCGRVFVVVRLKVLCWNQRTYLRHVQNKEISALTN